MCEKSPFISVRKVSTISSLDSFRGARRATMVSWHFGFFFCVANILKCIWTFREHLFLLPLSLLTSGGLRLGWPHFWSECFLSNPSPIIALPHSVTDVCHTLVMWPWRVKIQNWAIRVFWERSTFSLQGWENHFRVAKIGFWRIGGILGL